MSIDGAGDVAGDFHVLHLILADRHDISVISKDVGGHQRGVGVESHVDAVVIGFAGFAVAVDRGFVGVRLVHKAFWRIGIQDGGDFRNFRNVRLTIENRTGRVEAGCQVDAGDLFEFLV